MNVGGCGLGGRLERAMDSDEQHPHTQGDIQRAKSLAGVSKRRERSKRKGKEMELRDAIMTIMMNSRSNKHHNRIRDVLQT